jgi:uncharacterized membrane protein
MNQPEPHSSLGFERIVFFSDAVFAIAITLLVLEIKPPHLEQFSESSLRHHLLQLLPKFSGFVVSFLIIGTMWIEHHRIFRYIRRYNAGLLWRNLIFLLSVSFVPFPTAVFSEYFWSRTAFMLYAASFAGVGLTKLWVWRYTVSRSDLLEEGIEEATLRRISRRSLAVPIGCGTAIILSLVSVLVAPIGFILIPVIARLLDLTRSKKDRQRVQVAAGG